MVQPTYVIYIFWHTLVVVVFFDFLYIRKSLLKSKGGRSKKIYVIIKDESDIFRGEIE